MPVQANRVGIQIGASTPPAELAGVIRLAEELGYSEAWFAEDYFELGGIATVATALAATDAIPIGLGVVGAGVRHPAVTAMEYATLAGAFPGRLMAGLGHGAPQWVEQMGLKPASPMTLLREATTSVRRLLDGETITATGDYFSFDEVSLDHPPAERVPLYFGVQGPASLRLSGELVDGTLLGWLSSPGSVRWARGLIAEGMDRGGREAHHEIAALCLLSMSTEDPDGAGRKLALWAAPMLAGLAGSRSIASTSEGEELGALVERVGKERLGAELPLDLLRRFVATGTPEDCAATVGDLLDAGADRVVLVPNSAGFRSTDEMLDQITLGEALL